MAYGIKPVILHCAGTDFPSRVV